jgi:hypothetical protein
VFVLSIECVKIVATLNDKWAIGRKIWYLGETDVTISLVKVYFVDLLYQL